MRARIQLSTMVMASLWFAVLTTPPASAAPRPLDEPTRSNLRPELAAQDLDPGSPGRLGLDQDAVSAVADRLYDLGRDHGLAGLRTDAEHRRLTVYWQGTAPATVRDYLAAGPEGVAIDLVEHRRFSRLQAQAAAARISADRDLVDELGVVEVAVRPDGSGVRVSVAGDASAATGTLRLRRAAGLPDGTTVVGHADRPEPQVTRGNDASPWKGGIRTRYGNGNACSTAFATLEGQVGYLLTAHHCDPSANAAVTDGAGQSIAPGGNSVSSIPGIDSQTIDPSASPATTGRVYTGSYRSGTTAAVKGWSSNWTGDHVCNNGATSGTRCGTIIDDSVSIPNGPPGTFYIKAQADSGWLSAGGDSGGPWTAATSGGVRARGVHWGGQTAVSCGDIDPSVPASCVKYSYYVPISVVLNSWGLTLETS